MKKRIMFVVIIVFLAAVLMGCGGDESHADTAGSEGSAAEGSASTQTPVPEYTMEEIAGTWCVGTVLDAAGVPLSDSEVQQMGAGFSLELLIDGNYFVYDVDAALMGQGTYAVDKNVVIISAADTEMRYVINDVNTMRATSDDDSVTVMTRCCSDEKNDDLDTTAPDIETDVPSEGTPETTESL